MEEKTIELETLQKDITELQKDITEFLEINKRLKDIGMCDVTHDPRRNYLQADASRIIAIAKKFNLNILVKQIQINKYDCEVVVPDLKMYGITERFRLAEYGMMAPSNETVETKNNQIAKLEAEIKRLRGEAVIVG